MQKWQYKWVSFYKADSANIYSTGLGKKWIGCEQCDQYIDELGERGWELVGVTSSFTSSGSYMQLQMFFKRPKG